MNASLLDYARMGNNSTQLRVELFGAPVGWRLSD
jgi:hypothetical protein